MTDATRSQPTQGNAAKIELRTLTTVDEFAACVRLQRQVWSYPDLELVPRRMFVVARAIGGEVLGAYDGDHLVGYTMALPGIRDGRPYIHSHMAAVDPAYRNLGIGRRLKLQQRENAIARVEVNRIEWTFDPLEIKNGYFNVMRLGVISRRYSPNHYGSSLSSLQGSLPTDRLTAEWWIRSARVERVLAGKPPAEASAENVKARIEVPAEIRAWKDAGDPRAAEVQARNATALQEAFRQGLAIVGYERVPTVGGDAGAFLLGRWREDGA